MVRVVAVKGCGIDQHKCYPAGLHMHAPLLQPHSKSGLHRTQGVVMLSVANICALFVGSFSRRNRVGCDESRSSPPDMASAPCQAAGDYRREELMQLNWSRLWVRRRRSRCHLSRGKLAGSSTTSYTRRVRGSRHGVMLCYYCGGHRIARSWPRSFLSPFFACDAVRQQDTTDDNIGHSIQRIRSDVVYLSIFITTRLLWPGEPYIEASGTCCTEVCKQTRSTPRTCRCLCFATAP